MTGACWAAAGVLLASSPGGPNACSRARSGQGSREAGDDLSGLSLHVPGLPEEAVVRQRFVNDTPCVQATYWYRFPRCMNGEFFLTHLGGMATTAALLRLHMLLGQAPRTRTNGAAWAFFGCGDDLTTPQVAPADCWQSLDRPTCCCALVGLSLPSQRCRHQCRCCGLPRHLAHVDVGLCNESNSQRLAGAVFKH